MYTQGGKGRTLGHFGLWGILRALSVLEQGESQGKGLRMVGVTAISVGVEHNLSKEG